MCKFNHRTGAFSSKEESLIESFPSGKKETEVLGAVGARQEYLMNDDLPYNAIGIVLLTVVQRLTGVSKPPLGYSELIYFS